MHRLHKALVLWLLHRCSSADTGGTTTYGLASHKPDAVQVEFLSHNFSDGKNIRSTLELSPPKSLTTHTTTAEIHSIDH
jgi:hypothetical protein